jgi:O-antigen/teichoic acid export membrane protein
MARNISAIVRRNGPAAWSMGSRVLAGVSFLLVNSYLARRLGPVDFGTVAVVTSVAMFGAFVTSAGINRVLLRTVAGGLATGRIERVGADIAIGRRMLVASIPIGGAVTFLMSSFFIRHASDAISASIAGAFVAVGAGLMLLLSDLLRGLGEVPLANLGAGRNGGAISSALFAVLLAVTGRDLLSSSSALALNVLALALSVLASYFVYRRLRPAVATHVNSIDGQVRRLFVLSSVTIMGTQLAFYMSSQVDLWVASGNLTETEVGIYSAALRLMGIVSMPLLAAQVVVSSRIAGFRAQGRMDELEALVRRTATFTTVASFFILLPCMVVPGRVLTLVFGQQYASGGFVLAVLGLAQLVNVVTGMCGVTLTMCSKENQLLRVAIVSIILSIVFDLLGARIYGTKGLAVASAVTTSAQFIVLWWVAHEVLGIWTHPGRIRQRS